MAFRYDPERRLAVDDRLQATLGITNTFLDETNQPFEYISAEGRFYIDYEVDEDTCAIVHPSGDIVMQREEAGLRLQDWNAKRAFVDRMRKHLATPWPQRLTIGEAIILYQVSFEELERYGMGKDYAAWKDYLLEGAYLSYTRGRPTSDFQMTFEQSFPRWVKDWLRKRRASHGKHEGG